MTRVRNEQVIIADTVSHMLSFCDHLVLLDDASEDETLAVARSVGGRELTALSNDSWAVDRPVAETQDRRRLMQVARTFGPDWCIYLDADERFAADPLPDLEATDPSVSALRFRLFDAYLTDAAHDAYSGGELARLPRKFGPEYRSILAAWRGRRPFEYLGRDQREPVPGLRTRIAHGDTPIKHYGKAVSIDEWERTCEYYASNFPEPYRSKWAGRRGKALHDASVEGRDLYEWPVPRKDWVKLSEQVNGGWKYGVRRLQASVLGSMR